MFSGTEMGGNFFQELSQEVKQRPLKPNSLLPGIVDEVHPYFKTMDPSPCGLNKNSQNRLPGLSIFITNPGSRCHH